MRRIISIIFGVYFGLSCVYWLPGISAELLRNIKFLLIGTAVSMTWGLAFSHSEFRLPSGAMGFIGALVVLVFSSIGFVQSASAEIFRTFIDFALAFIMLWSFYIFSNRLQYAITSLMVGCLIIAMLCSLVVVSQVSGFPDWRAPAVFDSYHIRAAGFGAKRTGWSNGVSLFVPICFVFLSSQSKYKILNTLFFCFAIVSIIGSQYVVAGRGGLLASFIAVLILVWRIFPNKYFIMLVMSFFVFLLGYQAVNVGGSDYGINSDRESAEYKGHLRLDRIEGGISKESLDHFSAGRMGANFYAIEKIIERPLLGFGFGNATYHDVEIHNLWLKLAMEAGIMLPLFFAIMIFRTGKNLAREAGYMRYTGISLYSSLDSEGSSILVVILSVVLFQGVVISMVEPNALLGSFQATAIWWAILGISLWISDFLVSMRLSEGRKSV